MFFERLLPIAGISIAFIIYGGYLFGNTINDNIHSRAGLITPNSTLALAPLSLGNPSAAAGPETSLSLKIKFTEPSFEIDTRVIEYRSLVRNRDTLMSVLRRAGVSSKDTLGAVQAFSKKFDPRLIRSGQNLWLRYKINIKDMILDDSPPGIFIGFRYESKLDQEVHVSREKSDVFNVTVVDHELTRHATRSEGIIDSSLYMTGKKVGLPPSTLAKFIRIFSWDVDFQREIRKGDKFETMFYSAINNDGKIVRSDEIIFAALTLQGQRKTIYNFYDDSGNSEYFDEKGNSAQKALLRTPIDGARLSSGYGLRRHPILGYTKMHRGVDFAAPRGTPVYAAGNGVIELARRNGTYGKYVRIRHNGNYKTAYAHLSRYRRGIRGGTRVRQGEIIGYVGSTGRSTGNHLHYEIIRNGRKLNPMRVNMPSGRKLRGLALKQFQSRRVAVDAKYASLPINGNTQITFAD